MAYRLDITAAGENSTESFHSFDEAQEAFRRVQENTGIRRATVLEIYSSPLNTKLSELYTVVLDYENYRAKES
jgi:hypothetical protein